MHKIKGKWHFSSKYVSQDYILTILGLNSLGLDRFLVQAPSVVVIIINCSVWVLDRFCLLIRKGTVLQKSSCKKKVPPRFELGSLDSKSRVLTITPWDHVCIEAKPNQAK